MINNRYLETKVLSADPLELVHMVYEHALDMVKDARVRLAERDIAGRSKSICRAIDAIAELDGSLNRAEGGEISRNLAGLYRYMRTRLTVANLQQQDEPLAEVEALLATLAEAWGAIRTMPAEAGPRQVSAAGNWGGAFVPDSPVEFTSHGWSF